MTTLSVGVQLKLIDTLNAAAAKTLASFSKNAQKAAGDTTRISRESSRVQRTEYQRMAQAREALGVRSERTIQREIRQTEAAYKRLRDSGTMSFREQARAATAMRRQVQDLRGEMGKLSLAQKGRMAASAAAGIAAAGMVVAPGVRQNMSFDLRLAHMANTAFSDRDVAGRKAGAAQLNSAIVRALRAGGGDRDQAAETLDALIASGAFTPEESIGLLPTLQKSATASGAEATQLANIAIRGSQTFKISAKDIEAIIDMAISAGQAGGFELRDMARWLPQQMAAATMAGLSGKEGFAKLVAANQAAAITAGTKDEAGNNLVNLLAKLTSRETAMSAERLGINLPKRLATDREKGIDALDSFVNMVDEMVGQRTAWKQLQDKLAKAGDESEKRATFESMAQIVQGTSIGSLIQDRQALMALVALMNNRGYMRDVQAKGMSSAGAGDRNFALISGTAAFQTGQLANEKIFAEQRMYESVTPAIGNASTVLTEYAQKYPGLTTAITVATTALTALAAAAGAAGLATLATGGGVKGALGAAGGLVRGGGRLALGAARLAGPVAAAGAAGYGIGTGIYNTALEGNAAGDALGGAIARVMAFFGSETAQQAIAMTEKLRETEVGGEIRIKVDADGRASVQATSRNSRVPMNVDSGLVMMIPN